MTSPKPRTRGNGSGSLIDRYWTDIVRLAGLGIVAWQLFVDEQDRPYMLAIAGGMIGLKEVKKWQDKKNNGRA